MKNNLLQIRNFSMAFGENVLFTNFDYDFKPGIYVLSGPSGVGKSTLMRIIAGLETRYTGDIILNDNKYSSYSPNVHMVHQHYTSFPWLSLLKNTLMVYKGHKAKPDVDDVNEAKEILKKLGLEEHINKLPSQISGGQDQRLSLASAFINKWSSVILYDEPTSALDNINDMLIVDMIKEHQKKYGTIEIIITHEEHVIEGLNATILDFTPEFRLRPPKVTVQEEKKEADKSKLELTDTHVQESEVDLSNSQSKDEKDESVNVSKEDVKEMLYFKQNWLCKIVTSAKMWIRKFFKR